VWPAYYPKVAVEVELRRLLLLLLVLPLPQHRQRPKLHPDCMMTLGLLGVGIGIQKRSCPPRAVVAAVTLLTLATGMP